MEKAGFEPRTLGTKRSAKGEYGNRIGQFAWEPYDREKMEGDHSKYYYYSGMDNEVVTADEF